MRRTWSVGQRAELGRDPRCLGLHAEGFDADDDELVGVDHHQETSERMAERIAERVLVAPTWRQLEILDRYRKMAWDWGKIHNSFGFGFQAEKETIPPSPVDSCGSR